MYSGQYARSKRGRLRPELANVPVVMWSAIADSAFIEHAREKGAADYWTKASFNYAELPQMLGRLLPGWVLN